MCVPCIYVFVLFLLVHASLSCLVAVLLIVCYDQILHVTNKTVYQTRFTFRTSSVINVLFIVSRTPT